MKVERLENAKPKQTNLFIWYLLDTKDGSFLSDFYDACQSLTIVLVKETTNHNLRILVKIELRKYA